MATTTPPQVEEVKYFRKTTADLASSRGTDFDKFFPVLVSEMETFAEKTNLVSIQN